jgi:hypothetical protein
MPNIGTHWLSGRKTSEAVAEQHRRMRVMKKFIIALSTLFASYAIAADLPGTHKAMRLQQMRA